MAFGVVPWMAKELCCEPVLPVELDVLELLPVEDVPVVPVVELLA
jgi:hypothetical protein